ncbi:hypothetical protein EAI_11604 [Harpegnathos saltator]|uniref:Uncharacterized protein n=1 Tax=Harpegnathos saltator TaxID=610380 RepID=E2BVX1_HARSA|nr:hypothetical protein EAI_11604 [Harpegnathos saltator]
MSSSSVASTFGLNKNPQGGFGSFGIVSGTHEGPNPNDGTRTIATNSWSNTGHTESKSNTWPFLHTTPHTGFHVINTMFGTTRTPFDYVNTSGSSDGLYRPKGPKPIGFDVASSNITTNANTNAFDTSFGRYNIPDLLMDLVLIIHSLIAELEYGLINNLETKGEHGLENNLKTVLKLSLTHNLVMEAHYGLVNNHLHLRGILEAESKLGLTDNLKMEVQLCLADILKVIVELGLE